MLMASVLGSTNNGGWDPIGGVGDLINGATSAVSYWSDPWGNTFKALQSAAESMSKDILPALTSATLPDLSTAWFVNAYKISFATAIFVAILLLIPQAVRTARGVQAGRELVDSIGLYFGAFLAGAMFGPAIGIVLIRFFHSLSDVFVSFGVTGSIQTVTANFEKMIKNADPAGITGGIPIAVFLMLCMIVGLFMVMLILLVQLVTLYFTGVLFPLGLVWIIDPNKRQFGLKISSLWFGILAAHPLLFLLLGLAYSMMANQVGAFGNNFSLQSMVSLLVAIIALFLAALSPLLLMKFAQVLPMGSGGSRGPALATGSIGSANMGRAIERFSPPPPRIAESSKASSSAGPATPLSPSISEVSSARAAMGSGAGASGATAGAAASAAAAGSATASATAGTATAGGLAAAGAAETSTGVGVAIGIPTLLAAAATVAAAKTVGIAQRAGQHAVDAADGASIGGHHIS
jgi:type IV secretion system protein TrbL